MHRVTYLYICLIFRWVSGSSEDGLADGCTVVTISFPLLVRRTSAYNWYQRLCLSKSQKEKKVTMVIKALYVSEIFKPCLLIEANERMSRRR